MSRVRLAWPLLCCVLVPLAAASAAPGIPVTGRAVAAAVPVPDAQVLLIPSRDTAEQLKLETTPGAGDGAVARAVTDAAGTYRLIAPAAGIYTVRIAAAGFAPVETGPDPLVEETWLPDAPLLPDEGLAVTVTAGGKPVTGALVLATAVSTRGRPGARQERWRAARQAIVTGEGGTARLARAGALTVEVAAPGFVAVGRKEVRAARLPIALEPGVPAPLDARLPGGAPAGGAAVLLGEDRLFAGLTGADGRLDLRLAPGAEARVRVLAPGGARATETFAAPSAHEPAPAPRRVTLEAPRPLRGRIVDAETRRPVAGALAWDASAPRNAAVTDGSGSFTLNLVAAGPATVNARAAGYLAGFLEETRPGPRPAALALQPAAAIEGKVTDTAGKPVSGAEIRVEAPLPGAGGAGRMIRMFRGGAFAGRETRTRPDGTFRIGSLEPGTPLDVAARAKGFAPVRQELSPLESRRTRTGVVLALGPGLALTGQAVDGDGRPVPGVEVGLNRAAPAQGGGPVMIRMGGAPAKPGWTATTDAEGRFRVEDLAAGTYDVALRRNGFARTTLAGQEVRAPGTDLGRITLEAGETVGGIVVDAAGQPIEGVGITIGVSGEFGPPLAMRGAPPEVLTGSDGRFALFDRRRGERLDVAAQKDGYAAASLAGIPVPPEDDLRLVLRPSSRIEGRVVDADGKAIPGATISMQRQGGFGNRGAVMVLRMIFEERADETGRFVFENVEPGRVILRAGADGFQDEERHGLEVPEGQDLENVEITLQPGAFVEGRVLRPDGTPAAGATVGLAGEQAAPIRTMSGVTADGDGWYHLDGLKPGPASIEANADDLPRAVRDVELRRGPNTVDLRFPGGHEVAGFVRDEGGAPVARAEVTLGSGDRPFGANSAVTGDDGGFRFTGVLDGEYRLQASRAGYAEAEPVPVTVAGQPVYGTVAVLRRGGAITGSITGLDAAELAQVQIVARGTDQPFFGSSVRPSAQGTFRIEHLAPGTWIIEATLPAGGRGARATATLAPGQAEARADLAFTPGLRLSGRVLLGDEPVADAFVFAQPGDASKPSGSARTDFEGRFRIEGLAEGPHNVLVNHFNRGLSRNETVDVDGDTETTIRFPRMAVRGRVLDAADRAPVAGVSIRREGGAEGDLVAFGGGGTTTDEQGRFELANVPEGTWRITARKQGYALREASVTVGEGADVSNVEILVDATEGLTLVVRTAAGRAVDQVQAVIADGAGRTLLSGRYPAGENGRVRIGSVPPGTWEVLLGADGSATTALRATAPGTPTAVALPPACTLAVRVPALAEGGSGVLTVTGADGQPFRSLRFWGAANDAWPLSAGRARIDDLPPGTWTVHVVAGDGRTWTAPAVTRAGAPTEVILD